MSSSQLALQKGLHAVLSAHVPLIALLGGARIHDRVPQPPVFPHVTFGQSLVRDADLDASPTDEHIVTLHVWSRTPGRREAYAIIDALRDALHDRPVALDGHRLVNLRHEYSEARPDADGETMHGIVRLRAVTERT